MKISSLLLSLIVLAPASAPAVTIFSDNFNAPDSNNLDNSVQTGRRGGLLGDSVQVRSARIQSAISNNQLHLLRHATSGAGRVRFHDLDANGAATNTWHDFSTGIAGQAILNDGGFRVAFDWTTPDNAANNWISLAVGFPTAAVLAEPSTRLNHVETDFGILFRSNGSHTTELGGAQFFDNSVATTTTATFDGANLTRQVVIQFNLDSFADGSTVLASAWVDGTQMLANQPFLLENNGGAFRMELGSYEIGGSRFDNLVIETIPEPAAAALAAAGLALGLRRRRSRA